MTQDLIVYSLAGGAAMVLLKSVWFRVMGGDHETIPAQIKSLETMVTSRFESLAIRLDDIEETLLIADTKKTYEDKELAKLKLEHDMNMRECGHCQRTQPFSTHPHLVNRSLE